MKFFRIREAQWDQDQQALMNIRQQVFITEQKVPADLEWDGLDNTARHWLAEDGGQQAIGCVRLLTDGRIGRMAVVSEWRKQGVGSALLQTLLAQIPAKQRLFLHAQSQVVGFYQAFGFISQGDVFYEAHIEHHYMSRHE
ncbi:MAG: GNAT family N-acetyltransferase [gamma proteobacterium symbiont of Bathyaustriella thionipta]|nr:GNAT family N-acetyltransferase [gamma proteobacterium symbiont of Bathyaustriella thionipta]